MARKPRKSRAKNVTSVSAPPPPPPPTIEFPTTYGLVIRRLGSIVQIIHENSRTLIFETGMLDDNRISRFIPLAQKECAKAKDAWSKPTEAAIEKWFKQNPSVYQELSNTFRVYR